MIEQQATLDQAHHYLLYSNCSTEVRKMPSSSPRMEPVALRTFAAQLEREVSSAASNCAAHDLVTAATAFVDHVVARRRVPFASPTEGGCSRGVAARQAG